MATRVFDWIAHHANRSPESIAITDVHSNRNWTYAAFNRRISQLAGSLAETYRITRGDRVGVLAENSSDIFEIQFACARLGAVFLPLNWRLTVPELEFIVNDAAPKILFHSRQFETHATQIQALCGIEQLLLLDNGSEDSPYENALAQAPDEYSPAELDQDDLYAILYTSGTTGLPKGAMITHGMVFYNAVNLGAPALITPQSKHLSILPLFHIAGLNVFANPVFHAGGTVVVTQAFDPTESLALLSDPTNSFTHFFGVPANYLFISQQPAFVDADLSHLKVCGVGGAPCALSILEAFNPKGVAVQQGYGMTETSPAVLWLEGEATVKKLGSAGLPVLHNEVQLTDDNGEVILEPDEIGELWVRGPNVTPGYWNQPDATAQSITDGWLHTGDAAKRDTDGYYFIVDRWKDMYISGGENVYPAEVENVIYQMPEVAEVAVIGIPDERWGEVGEAIIAVKPEATIAADAVLEHCSGRLARYKQPKQVRFVEALPRNATGKVLKRELTPKSEG